MYGLLVENLVEHIKNKYGEEKWEEIRHKANVVQPSFSSHITYSETLIPRIARMAVQVRVLDIIFRYNIKKLPCNILFFVI